MIRADDRHLPDERGPSEPRSARPTFDGTRLLSATVAERSPAPERIPVTLIGGDLGAGESSLRASNE